MVDDAAKAIEFYKAAFGAKETLRLEKPDGSIGHAELKIGDSKIMISDRCKEIPHVALGSAISLSLHVKKVDEVVNQAIKNGAKLIRSIENTFYGDRIGTIEDPFENIWTVATHIEDVSLREMKKRAAEHTPN